ncbi:MAG: translation initiation factor IF-3 [Clostridiales bacterium]|nr:translation initiation factor IF-3 [Clostridiales bacterium]
MRRVFQLSALFFTNLGVSVISTKEHQINEEIRVPEVRLIGADGEQIGIVPIAQAQNEAVDKGLDLVMIAPQAQPPVCRVMDYGKFRFEQDKREKEAKKKQQVIETKEIQLSCNIGDNDFNTKLNHAIKFLQSGNKVRVVLKFRGRREMFHTELGQQVIDRFELACKDYGTADKKSVMEGRTITLFLSPITNTAKK